MPLTAKGEKIEAEMEREYGKDKGDKVFYASRNAGKLSGVDSAMDADDYPKKIKDNGFVLELVRVQNGFGHYQGVNKTQVQQYSLKEAKELRNDSDTDRLDALTNQLNSLGQGAKRIAERMDVTYEGTVERWKQERERKEREEGGRKDAGGYNGKGGDHIIDYDGRLFWRAHKKGDLWAYEYTSGNSKKMTILIAVGAPAREATKVTA